MEISERNTRATRYALIGRGTSATLLFLLSILVARYLGPESFGELSLAMTIIAFLAVIADGGINRSTQMHVSRYLRDEPGAVRTTYRQVLVIKTFVASVVFLLVYFAAPWAAQTYGIPTLEPLMKAGAVLLAALIIFEYLIAVIQGYESFRLLSAATILDAGSRLIATITIITLGLGAIGVMIGYASAAMVVVALLTLLALKMVRSRSAESVIIKNHVPDILRYSPPILLSTLFFVIYTKFDILALGYLGIASDVGHYTLAVGLIDNLIIPLAAIETAIMPIVASAYGRASEKKDLSRIFNQALTMGFLFMMPVIAGVIVVAQAFVTTVYGIAFANTALILIGLTPYILTKTLGVLSGTYLIAAGEARRFMWYTFGAVLINISLLLVLIPMLGVFGATLAKIASHTLLTVTMLVYVVRRFGVQVEQGSIARTAKVCLCALLMGLVCYGILLISPDGIFGLFLTILSGILIYVALLHVSGTLSFQEMAEFARGRGGLEL